MKRRLVVYVNSMNAFGGIERVIANLTSALSVYYDITILVKDKPISTYQLGKGVKIESINTGLKMNMDSRIQRIISVPLNIWKSIKGLKKWIKANELDYIYTAFPTNCLEMYLTDKRYRKRIVASEHASYYAYNSVYKKIKEWLYPRLEAISVPTTMDTEIYKKLGYKAYCIPHLSTYNAIEYHEPNSKTVINVGRLTSDKQQLMLLEIWDEVNHRIPKNNWKLQIIGSGEEKERLTQYITHNEVRNVELVPHTSNIAAYYRDAELFLFTSKMEGFGMVLLEAMSFGVPCISFDCSSGPRDIVKNEINGYLIPCYEKELYVSKVCEVIQASGDKRRKLRNGALQTIRDWDNRKIINSWISLFEEMEIKK